MLAGGATVPGLALIDTLPFVWQMVLKSVLWQVGRASATGAEIAAAAASPAINATELRRWVIGYSPFELIGLPFRGRRNDDGGLRGRAACCWPQRGKRVRHGGFDRHAGTAGHDVVGVVGHGHDAKVVVGDLIGGAFHAPAAWQAAITAAEASSALLPLAVKPSSSPMNVPVPTAS